jgi:hypothetical protein
VGFTYNSRVRHGRASFGLGKTTLFFSGFIKSIRRDKNSLTVVVAALYTTIGELNRAFRNGWEFS